MASPRAAQSVPKNLVAKIEEPGRVSCFTDPDGTISSFSHLIPVELIAAIP